MSRTITDHDEIRAWAEKHGAIPAAVDRTHEDDDVGIIRLMFPKAKQSEHGSLVEISWKDFFQQFDESGLALIVDETSNFNKFVGRDTAERRAQGENDAGRHKERGFAGDRKSASAGQGDDLKSREYRDAEGNIHHHTRAYMEGRAKDRR